MAEPPVEIRTEPKPTIVREFPISYIRIDRLLPHEETIYHSMQRLMDDLQMHGILRYPIVVSQDTYVVLDGHHRYSALKELGYHFAPVILLDYDNDDLVTVDTWYPIVSKSMDDFLPALGNFEKEIMCNGTDLEKAIDAVKKREHTAVIGNQESYFCVEGIRDAIFEVIREKYEGVTRYADNPLVAFEHASSQGTAVVSWSYSKQEIVQRAQSHEVFLPKTTRHTIKYRYPPINLNLKELEKVTEERIIKFE